MRNDMDGVFSKLELLEGAEIGSLATATEVLLAMEKYGDKLELPEVELNGNNEVVLTFGENVMVCALNGIDIILPDGGAIEWIGDTIPKEILRLIPIQRTKVLSLYAGPGAGKTTMAADVFARLKHSGYNVELVREYAKELVWEFGNIPDTVSQADILNEQYRRQAILNGQVDLIITDSPLMLSTIYGSDVIAATEYHNQFENFEVLIERKKAYNPKGRYQNEDEAKALDNLCQKFAKKAFPGTELGGKWLFDYAVDIIKGKVKP